MIPIAFMHTQTRTWAPVLVGLALCGVWPASGRAAETEPAGAVPAVVIVLDPGHGGSDAGVQTGTPVAEKAATLALAQALARVLQERGLTSTVLTRTRDTALPLRDRQETANRKHAAAYLTLHAAEPGDGGGILRVFVSRFLRDDTLAEAAAGEAGAPVRAIPADLAQNGEIRRSQQLAQALDESWRQAAGGSAEIVSTAPVAGVTAVHAPAVLVELPWRGRARGPALSDDAGRRRAAAALADGLESFLGRR